MRKIPRYVGPTSASSFREIEDLTKELERQKLEALEAKKALEDKIAEEMIQKGELNADEVSLVRRERER